MKTFTIERTYLVPHYTHVTVSAKTLADAIALAESEDNWEHARHDYDLSTTPQVTGAWKGNTEYRGKNLVKVPTLTYDPK